MFKFFPKISFIFLSLLIFYGCNDKNESTIQLSSEEQNWIKSNSSLYLLIDSANIPLNYTNQDGELVGYNVDLIKLLGKKIGVEINLIPSTWQQAIKKALSYEVDGIVNADSTKKRSEKLLFTKGLFNNPKTLICKGIFRTSDKISSFNKYKIAVTNNTSHLEILQNTIPDSNIIKVQNMDEAFDLLKQGTIQCVFNDYTPLRYRINKYQIKNVHIGYIESAASQTRIGIRKDKPVLVSILNKGISLISFEQKNELLNRWIGKEIK